MAAKHLAIIEMRLAAWCDSLAQDAWARYASAAAAANEWLRAGVGA